MSLAVVVLTKNGGQRIERLLDWAEDKPYIDELRVFVDATTTDDTASRCGARGAAVEYVQVPTIDAALAYCHSPERIKTDWALHIGDDELLGEWFDDQIDDMMRAPYDVYSLPRYNLARVPTDVPHYYSAPPLYPDWAQRLFRPGYLIHEGHLHEGPTVKGRLGMGMPHLFHFDCIDFTKEEREQKWLRYVQQGVRKVSLERGLATDYYKQWCVPEDWKLLSDSVKECEERL